MRLTHLAVLASIAALSACSDEPITQAEPTDPYDMSQVTVLKPEDYAAHGIAATPPEGMQPQGIQPLFAEQPCYIEPCPDPEPPAPQVAYVDFWGGVFNESNAYGKNVRLHAKSDAHNNMDQTTLSISYRSVGGCSATPAQFDSDYMVVNGAPIHVQGERYASYPYSMTFRWEVKSTHKFTANLGYVLPNGYRTYTWGSGGKLCV
ncbi:MAG TPA: hypothetical protein VFR37_04670 [Longimicrobium sp.]|nr:hypothetical protein [Longimicrobium sp.]